MIEGLKIDEKERLIIEGKLIILYGFEKKDISDWQEWRRIEAEKRQELRGDVRFLREDTLSPILDNLRLMAKNNLFQKFQLIKIYTLTYIVEEKEITYERQFGFSKLHNPDALYDESLIDMALIQCRNFAYANAQGYPDSEEIVEYQAKIYGFTNYENFTTT